MSITAMLVRGREGFLDRVLGIDPQRDVLNQATRTSNGLPGKSVAAEIKRAVNGFKAAAMDESGQHVDYGRLRDSQVYREYRAMCSPLLNEFDPSTLTTRQERLAFWINLYNALVIDAVIASGVQHSVTEGRLGLLTFFRRAAYRIGGQRVNLEELEHGIVRSNRGHPYLPGSQFASSDPRADWVVPSLDPRIHFALNCASRSCPPIGVYAPELIDTQLDLAAGNFIASDVQVDPAAGKVSLSHIFRWYARDFGGPRGVIDFLVQYMPEGPGRDWLDANRARARLVYAPYDWSLNV